MTLHLFADLEERLVAVGYGLLVRLRRLRRGRLGGLDGLLHPDLPFAGVHGVGRGVGGHWLLGLHLQDQGFPGVRREREMVNR